MKGAEPTSRTIFRAYIIHEAFENQEHGAESSSCKVDNRRFMVRTDQLDYKAQWNRRKSHQGRYVVRHKPALLESAAIGTQKQTIFPFESGHVPNAECATIAIIYSASQRFSPRWTISECNSKRPAENQCAVEYNAFEKHFGRRFAATRSK